MLTHCSPSSLPVHRLALGATLAVVCSLSCSPPSPPSALPQQSAESAPQPAVVAPAAGASEMRTNKGDGLVQVETDAQPTVEPLDAGVVAEPQPAAPSAPVPAGCVSFRQAPGPGGAPLECYPYRCRAGRCLKKCTAMADCAGATSPAEMPLYGYPLECMPSGECTPMHPAKLHR